jgi:hypothetical protein
MIAFLSAGKDKVYFPSDISFVALLVSAIGLALAEELPANAHSSAFQM